VRARTILAQLTEELEETEDGAALGFAIQSAESSGPGVLCLYSEEDGEPEHVIAFVKRCAAAFTLTGRWGFQWALTCSRPRPDGFGGGAHVLELATGMTIEWLDCEHWLAGQLAAATELAPGAPA